MRKTVLISSVNASWKSQMVFNRWGKLVYEGLGHNKAEVLWTGHSGGKLFPGTDKVEGTYFYVI